MNCVHIACIFCWVIPVHFFWRTGCMYMTINERMNINNTILCILRICLLYTIQPIDRAHQIAHYRGSPVGSPSMELMSRDQQHTTNRIM